MCVERFERERGEGIGRIKERGRDKGMRVGGKH